MSPSLQDLLFISREKNISTELLNVLFTEGEREELARRIQIIHLLAEGTSQREVAKQLGVGIATVTRGAKELAGMSAETRAIFNDSK